MNISRILNLYNELRVHDMLFGCRAKLEAIGRWFMNLLSRMRRHYKSTAYLLSIILWFVFFIIWCYTGDINYAVPVFFVNGIQIGMLIQGDGVVGD